MVKKYPDEILVNCMDTAYGSAVKGTFGSSLTSTGCKQSETGVKGETGAL